MAELRCAADTCSYNQEKYCCKGDIMVGGVHADHEEETCCESFRVSRTDAFTSMANRPYETISIDCEATRCVYNTAYKCYAESVSIQGKSAGQAEATACATYKKRR